MPLATVEGQIETVNSGTQMSIDSFLWMQHDLFHILCRANISRPLQKIKLNAAVKSHMKYFVPSLRACVCTHMHTHTYYMDKNIKTHLIESLKS